MVKLQTDARVRACVSGSGADPTNSKLAVRTHALGALTNRQAARPGARLAVAASAICMSDYFDITHSSHYRYAQPVLLGEHRVLYRPRGSHDMRVLATDLNITPPPASVRLIQDVYSNSVALVQPQSPADELRVLCTFTVEHMGIQASAFPLLPAVETYPFTYDAEDQVALMHYLTPFYDDPQQRLHNWATGFVAQGANTGTRELLLAMTQYIRDSMQYLIRADEGVQTPHETLTMNSGSCRDFATLMIEAVRQLGYAARFVSGYLYAPALDVDPAQATGSGTTHAWLEVYLPGAGWLPFDPTNNLVDGTSLIRVAVARHASRASPISGSWEGAPADYLGLTVDVQVHKRNQ